MMFNKTGIEWSSLRDALDTYRTEKGTAIEKEKMVVACVTGFVIETLHGELCRVNGSPALIDRANHLIYYLDGSDESIFFHLAEAGLYRTQSHTKLVVEHLRTLAMAGPRRTAGRLSHTVGSTSYLYWTTSTMVKVTPVSITEEWLGTDDVILIAPDIPDRPYLDKILPLIDKLRPTIGKTCIFPVAGSPMTALLDSRWDKCGFYTPQQAQQQLLSWFMFTTVASAYSLWPTLNLEGDARSGKSTILEVLSSAFWGERRYLSEMPRPDDILVNVTTKSLALFDNFDTGRIDDYSDKFATLNTGAESTRRKLYSDNTPVTYSTRNHLAITGIVSRLNEDGIRRRTITMTVAKDGLPGTASESLPSRDEYYARAVAMHKEFLAEMLLRAQNIVAALDCRLPIPKDVPEGIAEYSRFTYLCAAYDGTLEQQKQVWNAWHACYMTDIQESTPVVEAIRAWLGKKRNAGRVVAPSLLLAECRAIYLDAGLRALNDNPRAFGHALRKHHAALLTIGFGRVGGRNGSDIRFTPDTENLERCRSIYLSFAMASAARATATMSQYEDAPRPAVRPSQTFNHDVDYDAGVEEELNMPMARVN